MLAEDKIDPNAGYNLFANVSGDIRGAVSQMAEDKWGKPGSFLYNTALSMADFLTTTLVSGGFSGDAATAELGKKLALGIMSSVAAADATTAAKERGLDDQEAFTLGTIAGAAEILTERYSLDALLDPKWSDGALKYVTRNALVEGSEEVGSDLINTVADLIVAGDKNEIKQAIAAYEKQGHSESAAFGLALADKAMSLGADFLGGAISGAATSGARVAVGRVLSDVELRQSGKVLRERDANAAELLIRKAQEADVDSDVHKNAAALQQKLDNGGKIRDYEIGKLFSELSGYVQEHGPLGGTANVAQDTAAQPEAQPTLALPRGDEVQPTQTAPEPAPVDRASAQTASAAEIQPQAGETRDGNVQTPAQPEHASAPENAAQELTIYPPAVQQAWNILQDLQYADELTDAQQQMVDAAYATLNEYFAENDTQPEAMAPAERIGNNGQAEQQPDVLHLRGQQRVSAADDAGAVRPLEAGGEPPAGRTFDGRDGNRRQPRLANDRLREAQNRGLMPGSTRELGWADGTNEPRVILYPEDAWDEELQSVATQWRGQGYQVQFVIGPLEFQRDGFEQLADSVVQGNQIAIRANSIRWSAQQLSEHEGVHVWGGQHAQQRAAMLAELQDTLRDAGEPGMQMWSRYAEAYGEAYNGDQDALLEEIAADVWAGINRVGRYADDAVVDQLLQVVERYVGGNTPAAMQQMDGDTASARGLELDRSNPTRAGPGEQSLARGNPELTGETDSQGRQITQAQSMYFTESEVRDGLFNLLAVYPTKGYRSELGQWFSAGKTGSNAYYLNITNPYYTTRADLEDALAGYGDAAAYVVQRKSEGYDGMMVSDGDEDSYVTFYPQQAKRTSDKNPVESEPRYSLSRTTDNKPFVEVEQDILAGVPEKETNAVTTTNPSPGTDRNTASISDASVASNAASVKPELSDETRYSLASDTADGLDLSQTRRRLVNRTMNHAAKELRGLIDADTRAAREVQQNQLAALGRDILQKGSVPQSQVIDAFETIWAAGRQVDTTARDDAADIRDYLRRTGVSLPAQYRADVNGGDWNGFRRQNFGRLKITTEGLPVDQAYAELSGQRPDLFPADIVNPADQIQRMAEVAEQLRPQERDMDALYGSAAKGQIEASFIDMVDQMQQAFNPRERTFTPPAEWGDAEAEEADALWRLDVEADGEPVQDTMEGFQQPVQAAPVRLDSRAMGEEELAQQVRQTAAKYGQEGRLTPRDPDEAYHLDWVELMNREGDENQAQLEQRRTRWKGEAQKMQAAGASREEVLLRTGWYQTPEGEWRDFEQPRYNLSAEQVVSDAMAEQIQNEYLRNLTRDAFRGSKSLENLGVKIAGSVGNYTQLDQLIANDRAARRVTRDVRKAEKRLRPSPTEVQLARSMADGLLTWDDLPRRQDVDKNTVAELADYYQMEKSLALDLLDERKQEMFADVDYAVEQLMRDHDAVHISAAPIMHWRTPRRNLIRMFGRAQGQRMIDYLITPTAANEAERYRWTNKQYDMVREFEGEDGKKRALNRPERAATQLMLEGQAIEEQAAQLEERNYVYAAAEQLSKLRQTSNGKQTDSAEQERQWRQTKADIKQATGLNDELMEIADRLSQWRQAQADILANPEIDNQRVAAATQVLRERYASYYDAINDFLAAHGYKPIGFIKGYAPHLQPEAQRKGLQKILDGLGLGDQVTRLPGNIAGLTQQFRPNKRWDPFFLTRQGDKTKLDAIEGFETYVDYLSDIFYHMDDTIRARRMSNYFRRAAAADDIHAQISQAEDMWRATTAEQAAFLQQAGALPDGAALSKASTGKALQDYISKMYESLGETGMYSDFVNWLEDYANQLTAKQYVGDRGFETVFGRESLNLANKITNAFQRSQVAGNISSMLNQGAQSAIIIQECGPRNTMQALYDIANGKLRRDNFVDRSDFLTGKAGINRLIVDPTEKALHLLFTPAEAADTFVSTVATRAAYIQAVRDGMSDAEAMRAADQKAEQIMGSRMKGSSPQAFRSKNPGIRLVNMFQLESLNTFEYYEQDLILQGFRDIDELKDKKGKYAAIAKLVSTLGGLLVSTFIINRIAEEVYGGTPAPFDLIGYAVSFLGAGRGLTTNEEIKRWLNGVWRKISGGDDLYEDVEPRKDSFDWGGAASGLVEEIGSDLPMVRNAMGILGLGDQSMPIPDASTLKTAWETAREAGLSWDTGRDIFSALAQVLPGGRQLSKTFNGLEVMVRGGKWRGDRLQYTVENEIGNWLQALLFGPNGLEEQRGFYAGGAEGLSESESKVYSALTEAGMTRTEAYDKMLATHDLVPEEGYQSVRQIQKWEMLVDAGLSDSYLYAAVAASMADDQRAKLDTALDSGVGMPVYVAWRRQMLVDGGKTQEAMEDWLNKQRGLSNDAKATLWQLTNSRWKPDKNPYNVWIGEDIYAVYGPDED